MAIGDDEGTVSDCGGQEVVRQVGESPWCPGFGEGQKVGSSSGVGGYKSRNGVLVASGLDSSGKYDRRGDRRNKLVYRQVYAIHPGCDIEEAYTGHGEHWWADDRSCRGDLRSTKNRGRDYPAPGVLRSGSGISWGLLGRLEK